MSIMLRKQCFCFISRFFFAKLFFFLLQLACSYYNNHFHDRLWGEILPDQNNEPMIVATCTCFMDEFAANEEDMHPVTH